MQPVPWDGETMGEIMFRGNITHEGLPEEPKATQRGVRRRLVPHRRPGGAVPDGYIKIKDRSKDIIISGGENISSIEVEDVLYRTRRAGRRRGGQARPEVGRDAVRLRRTEAGRATVTPRTSWRKIHCKKHLAGFKVPQGVVFGELPKTSTGKIQKFESACGVPSCPHHEHDDIVDALEARDGDLAARLMSAHLEHVEGTLRLDTPDEPEVDLEAVFAD
jgi:fatty-acyl-CoA synthase